MLWRAPVTVIALITIVRLSTDAGSTDTTSADDYVTLGAGVEGNGRRIVTLA